MNSISSSITVKFNPLSHHHHHHHHHHLLHLSSSLFRLRCSNNNNISSSSSSFPIPLRSNFSLNNNTSTIGLEDWRRSPLKCAAAASINSSDSESPDPTPNHSSGPTAILKNSNSLLPPAIFASTLLALIFPPSLTWFTTRYYAPALGFLMFAVGVNSSEKDFLEAFNRPAEIATGYFGQFVVKPLLGYLFYIIAVTVFGLPTSIGAGIVLVACVSGAQLSNYATFLTDPQMAPLSIVMTSLSTASAVFVTPLLLLWLIGKRLPIDVKGMVFSITQIVVVPIAVGLLLNRFFPRICNAIRPFLPPLSVLVAAICAGAPLALNVDCIKSPLGVSILLLVVAFHLSAFIAGYLLSGSVFRDSPDVKPLQRTIAFETGMQSSQPPCPGSS